MVEAKGAREIERQGEELAMTAASLSTNGGQSVSVVIPTLGGESLPKTIDHLNRGTLAPSQILVCIPKEYRHRVERLEFDNVKLIATDVRGQVAQRAIGFGHARHAFVLQLDDDIILKADALEAMVRALNRLGPGNALAPGYIDGLTGLCAHGIGTGMEGWLRSFDASFFCGAPWGVKRMGTVTACGFNFGVDYNRCGPEPFEAQWLPGGCVLHCKDGLVKDSYYPFPGKAYCEDLLHSFLLKQKGIRLWVLPRTFCQAEMIDSGWDWAATKADYKARRHFLMMNGGQVWRMRICYLRSIVKRLILNRKKDFAATVN